MKRLALASLALLLYCSLGWMPVAVLHAAAAFVNSVQAGSTGGSGADVTTTPIDTTSGSINLIVVHVGDCFGCTGATAVIDNAGNGTYTGCGAQSHSGSLTQSGIFYKASPTTNAAHTFSTNTGSGSFPSIQVETFSGASGTPCDSGNTSGATAVATTIQPGSVTPTSTAILVAGVVWDTSAAITVSIDSGFSTPVQTAFSAGNHFAGAISYKLAVTTAHNPKFTFSANTPNAASRISPFLEAAATSTRPVMIGGGVF